MHWDVPMYSARDYPGIEDNVDIGLTFCDFGKSIESETVCVDLPLCSLYFCFLSNDKTMNRAASRMYRAFESA